MAFLMSVDAVAPAAAGLMLADCRTVVVRATVRGYDMGNGKPVLVVEDEPDVRSVVRAMLTEAGFEVFVAKDGASALHQLWKRGGNLALFVTDVDMGRMSGFDLAEMVRSQYPAVPILFISGLPVSGSELQKVAPGAALLTKPFDAATLIHAVEKAIDNEG
jgi:CheY-like chemotaxis protein